MARTRNHATHAVRRDAFVDVAAGLIGAKGYEALSVQEVIDSVGASKGAFYHYFGSKADLLEAVVERMADGVEATWTEILERPGLSACERLEGLFATTAQYKNAQRDLSLGILEGWLSDRNAILREKLRQMVVRRFTPAIERIVRQGIADGEFTATDPAATAQVVVGVVVSTQDLASRLFVARQRDEVSFDDVARVFASYEEALGRILGVAAGRLSLTDPPTLRTWFG